MGTGVPLAPTPALNSQASNRNVLVNGQRIKLNKGDVIGAGGFSKIYKQSSYEAVKVLNITGEFGERLSKVPSKSVVCLYEGKDLQTQISSKILIKYI